MMLIVFGLLLVSAVIVGTDNVTGIVLGYLATLVIMAEWTRRWRKIRYFILLAVVSVFGIVFLAFLHEVIAYPFALMLFGSGLVENTGWTVFHVVVSLLISFVGVVGIFIGIVGAASLGIWRLCNLRSDTA